MNIEENRLQTFNDWPSHAVVAPVRIAKAGMFYTLVDETVECFACHITISEWTYGDQVMAKHRLLNPLCPFVLDPTTSGNIPRRSNCVSPPPLWTELAVTMDNLQDEIVRLQTYTNWPALHIVTPASLAKAGFYFLQKSDFTKCAFCNGIVGSWVPGDDPDLEHQKYFPTCPFVRATINPRLETLNSLTHDLQNRNSNIPNLNLVRDGNLVELGVYTHKGPKRPKYGTLEARLSTFSNWPVDLIQTPDVLSQAGFYYEGSGDQVRCFHCDGGLKHWDPHDEPWTEHARCFPNCGYVLLVKGQAFIVACSPDIEVKETPDKRTRKEITERELQAQMNLPPALAALNIGLHVGRVKQALKEKIERTGMGFSTGDALIEATLNLQRDEEDLSDVDTQISRSVTSMLNDVLTQSLNEARVEERRALSLPNIAIQPQKEVSKLPPEVKKQNLSLEEENRLLKEARLCKICMDSEVGIVFLPCGHLATCVNCAPNLQDCPVCRSAIKATVRTFLS